ncbi:MAG: hypothetical protein JWR25_1810 [Noviherbaspirillum sp.]|jgi:hypothetical protein|nr:hypothetical protein [Noviherbaspirillum sp.]
MNNLNNAFGTRFGMERMPTSFLLRLGRREIFVSRDFRKRFYRINPIIDCSTGVERGHLEILLFRKWLVILSKAR